MNTSSTNIPLWGSIAVLGLALVFAGVALYRRRKERPAALSPQDAPAETGGGDSEPDQEAAVREGATPLEQRQPPASPQKSPLQFFLLVFALAAPIWLVGGSPLPIPVQLPFSAFILITPMTAALILLYRQKGRAGIRELFNKVLDFRKIQDRRWYLPLLALQPLITVLAYAVMRITGRPLPEPQIPWLLAPVILLVSFVAAVGEELGWMGYAFDPMQDRWGALKAGVLLGLAWALIHLIPDWQNGRALDWILWHRLGTVAVRILIVWIYNNTGKSVFGAILFHAVTNLAWVMFPNYGSHYDPLVTTLITLLVTALVLIGWEPKTLARFRFARAGALQPVEKG